MIATAQNWNPRYLAYCEVNGLEPEAMLALDAERHPGGKMVEFMCWIGQQWAAFAKHKGCKRDAAQFYSDEFDAWLAGRVAEVTGGAQ